MTAHVTVVGSLNMDLVVRAPRIPEPGETIIGGEFRTVPGGKGANQAVAAARLGAQVAMVGRVGGDAFGGLLLENLAVAGVDHTFVARDAEAATGVALMRWTTPGRTASSSSPGPICALLPLTWRRLQRPSGQPTCCFCNWRARWRR